MPEADALRFMRKLVVEGYILEKFYNTVHDNTVAYAELTSKGKDVAYGKAVAKVCYEKKSRKTNIFRYTFM